MKTKKLFLELGTEEIPSGYIKNSLENFKNSLINSLVNERILVETSNLGVSTNCQRVQAFATPRRFVFEISEILPKQTAVTECLYGPPISAAKDSSGNWTNAAIGFAKKNNIALEKLKVKKDEKGVEKLYAEIKLPTQKSALVIQKIIPEIISVMQFPKSMRWIPGSNFKYARPIRWIACFLDNKCLKISLENIISSKITYGHRFLSKNKKINLKPDLEKYLKTMEDHGVIVSQQKRKEIIKSEIEKIAYKLSNNIDTQSTFDEKLMDEVCFLTEFPKAVLGQIDKKFVDILPIEAIETCMKHHQRYFPIIENIQGKRKILPYFISITNGAGDENLVKANNEKVLVARLSDAVFFSQEDTKEKFSNKLDKLKAVVYQKEIGTYYDKTSSMLKLGVLMAEKLYFSTHDAAFFAKAIQCSKIDLITHMVYEFPELQGKMGGVYARHSGEDEKVCHAIYHLYDLKSSANIFSDALKIVDRLDTLISCFKINIKVSGSSDPYGLRRHAYTIVDLIDKNKLNLNLLEFLTDAPEETKNRLIAFFKDRIKNYLHENNISNEITEAVLASNQTDFNIKNIIAKALALNSLQAREDFKEITSLFGRVINILKQANISRDTISGVSTELLKVKEEIELYKKYEAIKNNFQTKIEQAAYEQALQEILKLKNEINAFFDQVMVMDNDLNIRSNRLQLLNQISSMFLSIADFSRL